MTEPPAGSFCLCHMDPSLGNWIFTADGPKLIDWEYAGTGHPYWDLAVLFQSLSEALTTMHQHSSAEEKESAAKSLERLFISEYGIADMTAWRRANSQMEYLCALWYRVQSSQLQR